MSVQRWTRLLSLMFMLGLILGFVPNTQAQQTGSCPVNAISVDDTNWQGAVVAEVTGTGCNVIIEIINTRPYWVNLRLTPVGNGLQITPDNAQSANLMGYRVLPPLGSIRLATTFTAPGQSVMALLDGTAAIDTGARDMTMVQAMVDMFSLIGVIDSSLAIDFLIEYYPTLRNAVVTSPNLQTAMLNLSSGNWNAFSRSMEQALDQGELDAFRSILVDIGVTVLIDRIDDSLSQTAVGRIPFATAVQVIYTNYSAALARMISEPAGFIILTAEGNTSGAVDLTSRAIAIGESASGTLIVGRQDTWRLDAAGGESVQINMDADFDTYLELYGPDGTEIGRNDDFNGLNAQVSAALPSAGTYTIIARAFADASGGAYMLRVSAAGGSTAVGSVVGAVARSADWTPVVQEFDGVPMVQVPPGCFLMGMTQAEIDELILQYPDFAEDIRAFGPQHQQCFDAPFWMDQTEVTQAQFAAFGGQAASSSFFTSDQRPVEQITWFEARDFCALRGARLPTEAEWEYAARGPDALVYPWGNEWNEDNAVWSGNSNGQTADVGSIAAGASWVGAFDLSGNVWEWVNTIYGVDTNSDYDFADSGERRYSYPYTSGDGREVDNENRTFVRVLRGGSWNNFNTGVLRSAYRNGFNPDYWSFRYGFRCARSS